MNAFLTWLVTILFTHYADGYRHGYTQATNDAWRDREAVLAGIVETQTVIEGLMAKLEEVTHA